LATPWQNAYAINRYLHSVIGHLQKVKKPFISGFKQIFWTFCKWPIAELRYRFIAYAFCHGVANNISDNMLKTAFKLVQ
jgi:hypothetical protein